MDLREFLEDKLNYNHDANERWILHLSQSGTRAIELCHERFSHILNAHHIWNQRLLERPLKYGVWDIHSLEDWTFLNDQLTQQTMEYIREKGCDSIITYQSTSGRTHQNTATEIIYHLVNHGTYHRGQLSLILSAVQYPSISTDYIYYSRIDL